MSNTGFIYNERCEFPPINPKGFPLRDSDEVMGLITHILFFGVCSINYIGFYRNGKLEEIFFINYENILETIDNLKEYVKVSYKSQPALWEIEEESLEKIKNINSEIKKIKVAVDGEEIANVNIQSIDTIK